MPTVLLQGETGTGKGLVARVIHASGARAAGPFVDVNCAAIPETMLEAELFGFEAGAFTDARRAKPGPLRGGGAAAALFLDEVDALPLALQSKLLKAIEEKRVRRLGAVSARGVDVKLIAATQRDLRELVGERALPRRSLSSPRRRDSRHPAAARGAAPTWWRSPSTSSASTRPRTGSRRSGSTPARAPGCWRTPGRATCAS